MTGQLIQTATRVNVSRFQTTATAVSEARRQTALLIYDWELHEIAEAAELVVSELMANAVNASAAAHSVGLAPSALTAMRLMATGTNLLIEVWDSGDASPVLQDGNREAEGGRGLVLVEALTKQWSFYRPKTGLGKVVWACLDLPAPKPAPGVDEPLFPLQRREPSVQRHVWPLAVLPTTFTDDPRILQRVADGLRALDDWTVSETKESE